MSASYSTPTMAPAVNTVSGPWYRSITREQWRVLLAAKLGWMLDAMDFLLYVMAIGRLAPQKDPATMVDAFGRVAQRHPSARLAIVGGGELEDQVTGAIAAAGLTGRIALLGVRPDAVELLAGADVYLSSSRWEGLARTILEAIALGIPVVATDVGGVRDVIEPGTSGSLAPAAEPAALAAELDAVIADLPAAGADLIEGSQTRVRELAVGRVIEAARARAAEKETSARPAGCSARSALVRAGSRP